MWGIRQPLCPPLPSAPPVCVSPTCYKTQTKHNTHTQTHRHRHRHTHTIHTPPTVGGREREREEGRWVGGETCGRALVGCLGRAPMGGRMGRAAHSNTLPTSTISASISSSISIRHVALLTSSATSHIGDLTHTHSLTHTHTHTCPPTHIHARTRTPSHSCTHTHTRTHARTHESPHTHTHTHTPCVRRP